MPRRRNREARYIYKIREGAETPYSHLGRNSTAEEFTEPQKLEMVKSNQKRNFGRNFFEKKSDPDVLKIAKSDDALNDTSNILFAPIVFSEDEYEFDHIIPLSKGGNNSYANAQIVSKKYNRKKRDDKDDNWMNPNWVQKIVREDGTSEYKIKEGAETPYSHLGRNSTAEKFTEHQKLEMVKSNQKRNFGRSFFEKQSDSDVLKIAKSDDALNDTSRILVAPIVFSEDEYEFDHIIPVFKGGNNSYANAQIVSKKYNRKKRNDKDDDWINTDWVEKIEIDDIEEMGGRIQPDSKRRNKSKN